MENGDIRPPGSWGSVTPEPIELKFGIIDNVRHSTTHAKIGSRRKGGWGGGMGEVVTSRAFFPFSFLNARTAYPENHGLTLNAHNHVFPCRLVS